MGKKKLIFAVDFDGTIAEEDFNTTGQFRFGAIDVLKALRKKGHKIILWTCREGKKLENALNALSLCGFVPDAVNENVRNKTDYGHPKVFANVYLDDKSFPPFPGWWAVYRVFGGGGSKNV